MSFRLKNSIIFGIVQFSDFSQMLFAGLVICLKCHLRYIFNYTLNNQSILVNSLI